MYWRAIIKSDFFWQLNFSPWKQDNIIEVACDCQNMTQAGNLAAKYCIKTVLFKRDDRHKNRNGL